MKGKCVLQTLWSKSLPFPIKKFCEQLFEETESEQVVNTSPTEYILSYKEKKRVVFRTRLSKDKYLPKFFFLEQSIERCVKAARDITTNDVMEDVEVMYKLISRILEV